PFTPTGLAGEEVSMQVQGSKIDFHENKGVEWIAIFMKCSMYWLWSGCYLAVIARREKRMLKTQLKEQQLASLQNQINPHFLFNSLNTIRGMIYQDQDKAADIVTQLSELFRYNLTTDLRTHVSVEDEWQICENYLTIEQVRFGERLKVRFDCPKALLKATLPSMSLLTLVENAVKHGIAHLPNGGELQIHVSEREGKVLVQVINPFDESRVKSGTQLGLANIQSRLELMFGQQAKLLISQERQEFKAIMEVPHAA
ncbi:MAG: histidine kinase, partial [Pseudomonadota bacterium]